MSAQPKQVKQNYLNNKDILKEIHASKISFCYLEDARYSKFDVIIDSKDEIFNRIAEAKENRANRTQSENYAAAMANHNSTNYRNKPKQKDFQVDLDTIADTDLVFRVMTYDHIPEEEGRKKNPKTIADTKAKVNFPPFKQYVIENVEKGTTREVLRSHWKGDLVNGDFNPTHGRISNTLGKMFLKLVERYSHRANWRGYTYVDEMRGQALMQLSQVGLQFNEARSDNPFAYYTQTITNSFTRILNLEKRNQTIRDDILIDQGHLPSYTRQLKHEEEIRKLRETSTQEFSDDIEAFGDT